MQTDISELYDLYLHHRLISTDTRNISPGCLFFAIRGETYNGNRFASEAIRKGAAYAVIDDPSMETDRTLLVNDVLESLQQLASRCRNSLNIPVIAVTGTNGKTTTKELMNAVLGSYYRVQSTKGNLNNHIGVPLTLLSIGRDTEIAIIEMGANHPGEIEFLCNLASPTHGLITNIGRAHLEGFGGYEGVIRTKSELYHFLRNSGGTVLVNGNNSLLLELSAGMKRILYGETEGFTASGSVLRSDPYLEISWLKMPEEYNIKTRLVGAYNFENVMAAICTGLVFNVPAEKTILALSAYTPSNNRSQSLNTKHNQVILDAYNANPSSMQAALQNFSRMQSDRKMVLLGDMLELGTESAAEHQAVVDLISKMDFQKVILVGPEFGQASAGRNITFPDSGSAAEWLKSNPPEGYTILVKGSRGIGMEKVIESL